MHGGDGIRYGKTQVVMAMYADYGAIAKSFHDISDQGAVLFGDRVTYGIGDIDGAGAGGDYSLRNLQQKFGAGAGAPPEAEPVSVRVGVGVLPLVKVGVLGLGVPDAGSTNRPLITAFDPAVAVTRTCRCPLTVQVR